MHISAFKIGKTFLDAYARPLATGTVVDIGAQDLNGSLKQACPEHLRYVGVDFAAGKGVDVVLDDPYVLPFEDESVDVVISSSCFEHAEMFWISYLEILRILKPEGLFYLNVPSNGPYHRHPVDCWRFYPDSGKALVAWGKRNRYRPLLLESFTALQDADVWSDFVAVFLKDESRASLYQERIMDKVAGHRNGVVANREGVINYRDFPEDQEKILGIQRILSGEVRIPVRIA